MRLPVAGTFDPSFLFNLGVLLAGIGFIVRMIPALISALLYWCNRASGELHTFLGSTICDANTNAIAYYLPKTVLRLTASYTVEASYRVVGGTRIGEPIHVRVLIKSLAVEPRLVADESRRLWLRAPDGSALDDVNNSIALGDDGTLRSLNSTITDKRAQVLESFAKAVGQVPLTPLSPKSLSLKKPIDDVKLDFEGIPGANQCPSLDEMRVDLEKSLREAYCDLQQKLSTVGAKEVELTAAKARIESIAALIGKISADMAQAQVSRDLTVNRTIDPAAEGDWSTVDLPDPDLLAKNVKLHVSLEGTPRRPDAGHRSEWNGVLYLQPRSLVTTISLIVPHTGATEVFKDTIAYAQFGTFAVASMRARKWAAVSTGLEFSAQSGRLIKLTRTDTGESDAIAKSSSAASDAISKELESLKKKSPEQEEIDRLTLETNLLKARAALRRAQVDPLGEKKDPAAH